MSLEKLSELLQDEAEWTDRVLARCQRRIAFEAARAAKQEAKNLLRIVPRVSRSKYSPNECQRTGHR